MRKLISVAFAALVAAGCAHGRAAVRQPAPPDDATRRLNEAGALFDASVGALGREVNDQVRACVDLAEGPLRGWFESALGRGARYLPRIRQVFAGAGIAQDVAYVALVESAFKPSALSRACAKGMWQFIP